MAKLVKSSRIFERGTLSLDIIGSEKLVYVQCKSALGKNRGIQHANGVPSYMDQYTMHCITTTRGKVEYKWKIKLSRDPCLSWYGESYDEY